jgi:hypothetical protein
VNPNYPAVARRSNHRCEYCRAPEKISPASFEVEHIFPTSLGGGDDSANLALACRSCNSFKSDSKTGWDDVTAAEVPLFDPRNDRWDQHFSVNFDAGMIHGLTPTGRATVSQLRMNDPQPLTARLIWIELGLFP